MSIYTKVFSVADRMKSGIFWATALVGVLFALSDISFAQCPGNGQSTTKAYFGGYVKSQGYKDNFIPPVHEITSFYDSNSIQNLQRNGHYRLSQDDYKRSFPSATKVSDKLMLWESGSEKRKLS